MNTDGDIMLQDFELEKLFVKFNLPEEARQMVRSARVNSPVRQVKSNFGNSVISFFSRKMGNRHLELESRTVEAPAATMYEHDPACLEFWPQPLCVDLVIENANGQVTSRTQHFPDFLLVRSDGIYIHEWREESRLLRLEAQGSQFYKDQEHHWHYRAAEKLFAPLCLHYEVHSSIELPRTFILNIRFLQDYQSPTCPPLPEKTTATMQEIVSKKGSVPFLTLLNEHGFTADEVFKAIAEGLIAADLYNDRLDASDSLMIHRDKAIARVYKAIMADRTPTLPIPGMTHLAAGAHLFFDGRDFEVILVGSGKVLLRDTCGQSISLPLNDVISLFQNSDITITESQQRNRKQENFANFSYEELDAAANRIDAINSSDTNKVSIRSIQLWKNKVSDSMQMADKIVALVDRNCDKGNQTKRLPDMVESLAEEAIRKYYNTPDNKTALAAYRKYQVLCDAEKVEPMSYPTFTKRVKISRSVKDRGGKRKAYQETEIPLYLDYMFPIHGVRPHEVCYIDHTTENLATVGPNGSDLGKPTLTLATDGHTTQTRAFYLSYDPPSAKVVLMTLRDYVRRHNRLPRILVVDGAKEFRSEELKWFCRLYEIDLRHRPPGAPRGGAAVESALGVTEIEVIAQMQGNTRIMKNVRMVTKSVSPFPRAIWTLTALHQALDEFLFEIRSTRIHPTLGSTPRDYESMRIHETGQRDQVLVKFDENIMLLTCPHAKHRIHKVDRIRGVWCDNMFYWHDDFKTAKKGDKVEVRLEPWISNVVYTYYRGRWVAAIARDLRPLAGRTSRETELAKRAERRLAKANAIRDRLGKGNSKKMVGLWAPEKFDERIGMQQREMEYLYKHLGMTVAMPDSIPAAVLSGASRDTEIYEPEISSSNETTTEKSQTPTDDSLWDDINGYH